MAKTRDELLHAATQAAWAVLKLEKGKGTNQHNANVSTRAREAERRDGEVGEARRKDTKQSAARRATGRDVSHPGQ